MVAAKYLAFVAKSLVFGLFSIVLGFEKSTGVVVVVGMTHFSMGV